MFTLTYLANKNNLFRETSLQNSPVLRNDPHWECFVEWALQGVQWVAKYAGVLKKSHFEAVKVLSFAGTWIWCAMSRGKLLQAGKGWEMGRAGCLTLTPSSDLLPQQGLSRTSSVCSAAQPHTHLPEDSQRQQSCYKIRFFLHLLQKCELQMSVDVFPNDEYWDLRWLQIKPSELWMPQILLREGRKNISQPEGISGADKPQERVGLSWSAFP